MSEERKKLPRLYGEYTTGDAQEWTYEYTWEDFERIAKKLSGNWTVVPSLRFSEEEMITIKEISKYFLEHPEKLVGYSISTLPLCTPKVIKTLEEAKELAKIVYGCYHL
jgi:hypothetical protein